MVSALVPIVTAFAKLCVFRIAPQDIPRSGALLVIATLTNLSLSVLINQIQLSVGSALLVAAIEIIALATLTAVALFYVSHLNRLIQTMTALMGSGAVIGAAVLILMLAGPALPPVLRLAIFVWNLAVIAHILRHALEIHIIGAFFIALGYAMCLIQLIIFIGRSLGADFAGA